MRGIAHILNLLGNVSGFIAVSGVLALMMLTVVTVTFRAFGIAFPGTYAIAELLLIPAISFSLLYATLKNEHTRVTLIVGRIISLRVQHVIKGLMLATGSIFWMAVTLATVREAIRRGAQGEVSPIINLPVPPFRWMMAAAMALIVITLLFKALQLLTGRDDENTAETSKLENKL